MSKKKYDEYLLSKDKLRDFKHHERQNKSSLGRMVKSNTICKQIIKSKEFKDAVTIAVYFATDKEVNLKNVVKECFLEGKRVAFPRVGNKEGVMDFYVVSN
jgi:5-formyltetrahydrofolate cyclo-ligase